VWNHRLGIPRDLTTPLLVVEAYHVSISGLDVMRSIPHHHTRIRIDSLMGSRLAGTRRQESRGAEAKIRSGSVRTGPSPGAGNPCTCTSSKVIRLISGGALGTSQLDCLLVQIMNGRRTTGRTTAPPAPPRAILRRLL